MTTTEILTLIIQTVLIPLLFWGLAILRNYLLSKATTEELQQMREVAKNLGRDFPISATQAAEGMDRLAAGGFNANQTMQAMPAIVTAAVASGEELATTSDGISSQRRTRGRCSTDGCKPVETGHAGFWISNAIRRSTCRCAGS